jgi:hypothetical protein
MNAGVRVQHEIYPYLVFEKAAAAVAIVLISEITVERVEYRLFVKLTCMKIVLDKTPLTFSPLKHSIIQTHANLEQKCFWDFGFRVWYLDNFPDQIG